MKISINALAKLEKIEDVCEGLLVLSTLYCKLDDIEDIV